jgi:hypothetical protein
MVRRQYREIISRIIRSRPYQVGEQIDWAILTGTLPQLPSDDAGLVLYLLRYAADEQYLSLLESYFDDVEHYHWALSSWVILAYTQRYTYDSQVLPSLRAAQEAIEGRFDDARRRLQKKLGRLLFTKKELLHSEPWFRGAKAWARQQFAGAEKHIRQHIQIRDRTAFMQEYEEKKLVQAHPNYFPTLIQGWLALPTREEKIQAGLGQLQWTFQTSLSLPIDEVAQSVKVLMDYVLSGEDPSVSDMIWGIIGTSFGVRRYVGTYLDWERLTDELFHLNEDRKDAAYHDLTRVLDCLGQANDEHYLAVLKPYLDHSHVNVRWTAARTIRDLIWHLAHYCSEVAFLMPELASDVLILREASTPPERWQVIKDRLEQLEHNARLYFHYYSI